MCVVSYFAVKAMLLLIDCKYKVLAVIYQYESLTEDLHTAADSQEVKMNLSSLKKVRRKNSNEKVKCVNGNNYVEESGKCFNSMWWIY